LKNKNAIINLVTVILISFFSKKGFIMNKQSIVLTALLFITAGLQALTEAEAKTKGENILRIIMGAHTQTFVVKNLFSAPLDPTGLTLWNQAISAMKTFVTTIINENKNLLGMKDSTIVSAFEKITKAEQDLVNTIKITRGVLKSPTNLDLQIEELKKIKNNMLAVQATLAKGSSVPIKNEAYKILNSTAMFIETTAGKAVKDAALAA
jgi:hypothetical protein